jgi:RNA polymerase primary sigma factor
MRAAQVPVSLEKPVGEDGDAAELGHLIPDETAISPFDAAMDNMTKHALQEALENLSYRERRIVELRYGLDGESPRTLDQVSKVFNLTRERARQIEEHAIRKLASLAEAQALQGAA